MSEANYFLGVDIGGTKSHALIADQSGRVVGFGEAGAGSPERIGYDGLAGVLWEILQAALVSAGIESRQVGGAGFGVAGYDWPSQRKPCLDAIATLGLRCPVDLVNDTLIGLIAGASQGWGVAVVSGTGCNCWGMDRSGRTGRVTGNGGWSGEAGGAYDLIQAAMQAVSRQWSRRGPETRLTQAFLRRTGAPDWMAFFEGLVNNVYRPEADDCKMIFRVAAEGDAVAREVLAWGGRSLADLALGVIRQLDLQNEVFEIVQVGSVFLGGELLVQPFQQAVLVEAPRALFVPLPTRPVVGGVLLGMRAAGVDFSRLRPTLIQTFNQGWHP